MDENAKRFFRSGCRIIRNELYRTAPARKSDQEPISAFEGQIRLCSFSPGNTIHSGLLNVLQKFWKPQVG